MSSVSFMGGKCLLLATVVLLLAGFVLSQVPHPTATLPSGGNLSPRQTTNIFPTVTYTSPIPGATDPPVDGPPTSTGEVPTTRLIGTLTVASTPIPIAATMAMVMPNPWQPLYVGLNYTFGFVDAVPRPAPTTGGWLRTVTPLLIFPDRTVHVFPNTGVTDPGNPASVPYGSTGLCGTSAFDWAVGYPFQFWEAGWYMFIINQTWIQPTVVDNVCQMPLVSTREFFSTQTFSIAKYPDKTPGPSSPLSAYTVFGAVVTNLPGELPVDPHVATKNEALGIGLGVASAVTAVALMTCLVLWVRRKRRMESELLAFGRMKPEEQIAFLMENPESWLNPANQRPGGFRNAGYQPGHYNHPQTQAMYGNGGWYGQGSMQGYAHPPMAQMPPGMGGGPMSPGYHVAGGFR